MLPDDLLAAPSTPVGEAPVVFRNTGGTVTDTPATVDAVVPTPLARDVARMRPGSPTPEPEGTPPLSDLVVPASDMAASDKPASDSDPAFGDVPAMVQPVGDGMAAPVFARAPLLEWPARGNTTPAPSPPGRTSLPAEASEPLHAPELSLRPIPAAALPVEGAADLTARQVPDVVPVDPPVWGMEGASQHRVTDAWAAAPLPSAPPVQDIDGASRSLRNTAEGGFVSARRDAAPLNAPPAATRPELRAVDSPVPQPNPIAAVAPNKPA
ncbi:MAG: hypothetical protein AAFQ50_16175, partial [Pseudomonadota bacterium]